MGYDGADGLVQETAERFNDKWSCINYICDTRALGAIAGRMRHFLLNVTKEACVGFLDRIILKTQIQCI